MTIRHIAPFGTAGYWFKGNLHTHTTQSDGQLSPDEAIEWYRQRQYDFLAITDHWVLTRGRAIDTGFITITGAELHGQGYHLLSLGLSTLPDPALADDPQTTVSAVRASGGLAFFAHPYWTALRAVDMAAVSGFNGIEVYNSVCEEMDGLGDAHVHWDELLGQGRRLLGLAVDDVHWRPEHQAEGKGFVMVKAEQLDEASLLQAIAKGHFYASTGPRIESLALQSCEDDSLTLSVRCSPCRRITFHAHGPLGNRFTAQPGQWLDGARLSVRREQVFVRVACEDEAGRIAWSNPIFVEDIL
jgi:hypothetical protein